MVTSTVAVENSISTVMVDLNLGYEDGVDNHNLSKVDTGNDLVVLISNANVASGSVVVEDSKETAFGLHHEKLELCDISMVVLNNSSSELVVASDGSLVDSAVPGLSPNAIVEEPFIDVPIFIISNAALRAHLGLAMTDPCVDHSDCLDESFSSSNGGVGEDLDGAEDEFNEMFNLNMGHIVDNAFSIGDGKRCCSPELLFLMFLFAAINQLNVHGFLNGHKKSRSFLEALSRAFSLEFPEPKVTAHHSLLSLWILEEKILALAARFEYALVGKFPIRRPSLELIPYRRVLYDYIGSKACFN
ncbi:hypothetical protein IEQ34_014213 [Dendrobium chrysotoxum]|uniref:Transposase n=1 Tax=Dendrobium chrysotoxum TaxID=161865 RepID=A0AAV7GJL2_DENCH|nr:hypothetical protein IEQ34_014213 [Dendrobium chrysotoxum]